MNNIMNLKKLLGFALLATIVLFTSCEKEFDSPPISELPVGNIISIDSVRNIYTAFDTIINDNLSVFGVITADETSGNIYKELYLQDETNAIKLGLTSSSDFYIGDKIRVSLQGATITRDNNMLMIDNLDPYVNLIKQDVGLDLTPEVVTINDLAIVGIYTPYQAKLVRLDNVEFLCSEMCKTWANAITQYDENRTLVDTLGNAIIVRSSGYASFAGATLPSGQGSITAVVSQYGGTLQLTIRSLDEVTLYGERKNTCAYFLQDFSSEMVTTCGWSQQNVIGNVDWTASDLGASGNFYGVIKNIQNFIFEPCETWLVSPSVDLTGLANPMFAMSSDVNYAGAPLEVYITTNYTGDVTTTTWNPLAVPLDPNNTGWGFYFSNYISLATYQGTSIRVAFKYTGSSTDGSTWEVDDISIEDI
jgi:hypothetical protein